MGTGIVTVAILLIVGYVVITRLIGLAFRLVVPAVILFVLAGAGLFSSLAPNRGATDAYPFDGYERRIPEEGRRLGDLRLRDIADGAVDTARAILRSALALLDRTADPQSLEPLPPYSGHGRARDRFDGPSFGDEPRWDGPSRPGRAY